MLYLPNFLCLAPVSVWALRVWLALLSFHRLLTHKISATSVTTRWIYFLRSLASDRKVIRIRRIYVAVFTIASDYRFYNLRLDFFFLKISETIKGGSVFIVIPLPICCKIIIIIFFLLCMCLCMCTHGCCRLLITCAAWNKDSCLSDFIKCLCGSSLWLCSPVCTGPPLTC